MYFESWKRYIGISNDNNITINNMIKYMSLFRIYMFITEACICFYGLSSWLSLLLCIYKIPKCPCAKYVWLVLSDCVFIAVSASVQCCIFITEFHEHPNVRRADHPQCVHEFLWIAECKCKNRGNPQLHFSFC